MQLIQLYPHATFHLPGVPVAVPLSVRPKPYARGPPGYVLVAASLGITAFGLWRWANNAEELEYVWIVIRLLLAQLCTRLRGGSRC